MEMSFRRKFIEIVLRKVANAQAVSLQALHTSLLTLGLFLLGVNSVAAQTGLGVMDRSRPSYDAKGIPLGGFRIFPTLDAFAGYDSNVYALPLASSDYFFVEDPAVRVQSQWGRHFLEVYGGANNYNYQNHSQLSLTDWDVGSDGRFDIMQGAAVSLVGSYGEYHEVISSANRQSNQFQPNRYFQSHVATTGTYHPDHIGLTYGVSWDHYAYKDTPLAGGALLDNADRDESVYAGFVESTYQFSPGYEVFAKAAYDKTSYDERLDRSGIYRNSIGYRFSGGLNLLLSQLLVGQVGVGYLDVHFDQHQIIPLRNISGLDFAASLDWYTSDLLTVHLNAERDITPIVIANASASDDRTVKLSGDYEILRNLIGQVYVSFGQSQIAGIGRVDNYPAVGAGLRVLIDEHFSANLMVNYSERSSNFPDSNFQDNVITIGITGHV
jgi:hypothetical protein